LRKALDHRLDLTEAVIWSSFRDVRETFPTADGISIRRAGGIQVVATVFNIKGNEYRPIAIVNYVGGTALVREVLTHAEYSKGHGEDRL
jgi:mRNA-degrading endonuclease HigB of HigAB toxin-antitoxin module